MRQVRTFFLPIVLALFIISAVICGSITVNAEAVTCSLTLTNAVPGSTVSLYQIQVREKDGTYTTTPDFEKYSIDLHLTNADEMRSAALTLESYIIADQPQSRDKKTVDDSGTVQFTGLPEGLYVALGSVQEYEKVLTEQSPVIAYLPASSEDQRALYDLTVEMKRAPVEEKVKYKVYKTWKNDEASERPKEIKVALNRSDGQKSELVETVTLNKENNWSYSWDGLEKGYKYSVAEISKDNRYKVTITEESGVFTVCKTKGTTPPPPNTKSSRLPQTGQLWWPVAVLAIFGALFLAIGMKGKSNREK